MHDRPVLQLDAISRSFGPVQALSEVSIDLKPGEILGLLGANGAGKSTLMNILCGLHRPDSGQININGSKADIRSPAEAAGLGIGMVHQHFMLVPNMTVSENIALSLLHCPFFNPLSGLEKSIRERSEQFGLTISPDEFVINLSAGERQRVELMKVLLLSPRILILDEPTSVLTPREAAALFAVLRRFSSEGRSAIFISHKLEEVMQITNRVAVMKNGRLSGVVTTKETDSHELARLMLGSGTAGAGNAGCVRQGDKTLDVSSLTVIGDSGTQALTNVSFCIRSGEILGIAGVSGNGQRELSEAICGLRPVHSGRIFLNGIDLAGKSVRSINEAGVSAIPEERIHYGVAAGLSITDNAILKDYYQQPFSVNHMLQNEAARNHASGIIMQYQVSAPGQDTPVRYLSGGNIQKVIAGREIERRPILLIASHPTYGLDVGATDFIRSQLLLLRHSSAILLISESIDELIRLCDRIAVICAGRITGEFLPGEVTLEQIGLMMGGESVNL
ncbi:MAG: ABC transporter ATP-binding protein [Candidatus Wallbacteria bacterium]|nr:ABC transporter ATP-binding protein [Candidatus Wallbacteria bacterium]